MNRRSDWHCNKNERIKNSK